MFTYADQISTKLLYGKYHNFLIVCEIMCWPKYELKNHSMVSARVLRSVAHCLVILGSVPSTVIDSRCQSFTQGGLKPGFRSNAAFCSQTSPTVALVQWNRCILQVSMHNWITYIHMRSLAYIMQRFHWTKATFGDVWLHMVTFDRKPGFSSPCDQAG